MGSTKVYAHSVKLLCDGKYKNVENINKNDAIQCVLNYYYYYYY